LKDTDWHRDEAVAREAVPARMSSESRARTGAMLM
jgi:hypothetical protein